MSMLVSSDGLSIIECYRADDHDFPQFKLHAVSVGGGSTH